MDNFLDSLRVRNIFGSLFNPDPNGPVEQPLAPQMNSPEPMSNVPTLFNPSHEAQNRLMQLLDTQPKHEDYKPSFWRKLATGGVSMSIGPQAGEAFRNRPYDNAMADWNAKLKPLTQLSGDERAANTNDRLVSTAIMRDQNADLEHERRVEADKTRDINDKAKLEERYAHLAYLKEKSANPNSKPMSDKDGYLFTPLPDGSIRYLIDDNGDKVKSDKLPDQLKLEIQQNNRLAQISAQGGEQRKNIAATGSQQRQNITATGDKEIKVENVKQPNRIATKTATPGKNTTAVEGSGSGSTSKHKIGEEKVFPNGKVGRWDGNGYVDTGKVAK